MEHTGLEAISVGFTVKLQYVRP